MEEVLDQDEHVDDGDGFGILFRDDFGGSSDEEQKAMVPTLITEEYVRTLAGAMPSSLTLALVCARHSLWGHLLWNAAIVLAEMMDVGEISVEGKTVLELGAGAGLPGLIGALKGAEKVVISDYATSTDQALMVPIKINIERIQPTFVQPGTLHAVGHVWGQSVADLLAPLREPHHGSCLSNRDPVQAEAQCGTLGEYTCGCSVAYRRAHARCVPLDNDEGEGNNNAVGYVDRVQCEKSRNSHLPSFASRPPSVEPSKGGQGIEEASTFTTVSAVGRWRHAAAGQRPDSAEMLKTRGRGNRDGCGQDGEAADVSPRVRRFDMVIMADLLFNRSQHAQLLETCDRCLARSEAAVVWVSFSHHDPEKRELDMKFFELASLKGFASRHIKTVQRKDHFMENDGLDELRGEVHLWCLTRKPTER